MTSKEEEKEKNKVNDNVQVVCRFRPLNQKEIELKESGCVIFYDEQTCGLKSIPELKFTLDHIFDLNSTQEQVYKIAALPVVKSVLEGFNGTILAYGQTSSGKTFTMSGLDITDRKLKGIIPRMIDQVFYEIYNHPEDMEFRLKVSIMEIYMEKIQDLIDINKHDLKIREDKNSGIYIQDLTEVDVDEDTVYDYYELAMQNRHIASTGMNAVSSRSHSLFSLTITQKNLKSLSVKTGKLFLVDLAGSEKLSKTGAQGQTMEEGKKINQSLSCLGNVINALTDNSSFIPYRNSKLTRVLQDSLGGNSKTTLIVTASPAQYNEAETLSTLRFGVRAKKIQNKPKINKELSVAELQIQLDQANKQLELKNAYIELLKKQIKQNGIEAIEFDERQLQDQTKKNKENGVSQEDVDDDKDNLNVKKIQENSENSEKLRYLSSEFLLINKRFKVIKEENDLLIKRVAEYQIKQEEFEDLQENFQKQEREIQQYIKDDEKLHKLNLQLMEQLQIKNKEIEDLDIRNQDLQMQNYQTKNKVQDMQSKQVVINQTLENENLVKKINDLQNFCNDEATRYQTLIGQMSLGEKLLKKKVNNLEQNIQQLVAMYQDQSSKKSKMKFEIESLQKKNSKQSDKIQQIQADYKKLQDRQQNNDLDSQNNSQVIQTQNALIDTDNIDEMLAIRRKVTKVIRPRQSIFVRTALSQADVTQIQKNNY